MINQQHTRKIIGNQTVTSFPYEEYGINGVGQDCSPIISMDSYINHNRDLELHIESCKGLALCNDFKMGMVYGGLPPEEVARFGNHNCWSEMLHNLDMHDPTGIHRQALKEVAEQSDNPQQAMYKYAYFAMGSVIPWFFACYLKKNDFSKKTKDLGGWTDNAKYFPKVVEYLDTLPFKEIGRVLFFTTYPNAGVAIHRDSVVAEHKDHNINLFFDGGWRPSFIWDEKTKEKKYLEKDARSYFFNNRDYHGVEAEPIFRYTLRVDGTFTDELCEDLKLEDGYTWKWKYQGRNK
jgi:hypothetical protein